jgi:hypothetical protein
MGLMNQFKRFWIQDKSGEASYLSNPPLKDQDVTLYGFKSPQTGYLGGGSTYINGSGQFFRRQFLAGQPQVIYAMKTSFTGTQAGTPAGYFSHDQLESQDDLNSAVANSLSY